MRSIRQSWSSRNLRLACIGFCLAGTLFPVLAQEAPPITPELPASGQELLLDVKVNDNASRVLARFRHLPDGKLAATPDELRKAGFRAERGVAGKDGFIPLDSLPGVAWEYNDVDQMIAFTAPDQAREPTTVDLGSESEPIDYSAVRSDFGLVTNYTLYATSGSNWHGDNLDGSLSGSVESRLLTPFGTLSTSGLGRMNPFDAGRYDIARLDSAWRYVDPKRMLTYQIGDTVSGALSWSSSYRLGGLQIRRNFGIRPDLVTTPVPSLSGSASVPSTLDLYLNNMKVYSGDVPSGPFDFSGLPFLGGGGDARIVMKDALGRESVIQRSYFFAPGMLRKGYVDYSAEVGFPRLGYGYSSFNYASDIAASASIRYGLTNWLTLEGHAEGIRSLVNTGAGFAASLGPYGSVNASVAASRYEGALGEKISAYYQVSRNGYSFYIGGDRMIGDYNDVGLVADRRNDYETPVSARSRQVDRVGVSFPLGFDPSSLSLGFSRVHGAGRDNDSSLVSASWSRTVFDKVSLYVTGYGDLGRRGDFGVYAGLSMPIGKDMTASASLSRNGDHIGVDTSLSRSSGLEEGAVGWTIRDHEGGGGNSARSVSANYRTRLAQLSGSVEQSGDQGRLTGTIEGSVVAAGGGVFLANRVDDAFAVVKAGGPNVDVSVNSRRVAKTNSRGRALVPSLDSYRRNRISIDPANLSFDLQPDQTEAIVIPADRSGAVVDFGVSKVDAAIVSLTGPDGKSVPLGAAVQLDGSSQSTVAGYDGRTYLTGLSGRNSITVTLPENAGTCHATFDYAAKPGAQPEIGPIPCR